MAFKIDKEGLITDKDFIDKFCGFFSLVNNFAYNIDGFNLYNWERDFSVFFDSKRVMGLSKKTPWSSQKIHILVLTEFVFRQDDRKLIFDYSVNIINFGKMYTTYDTFFEENNISNKNFKEGFGNNSSDLEQLGNSNWEFIGYGKHRQSKEFIAVLEKEHHRILVNFEGITLKGKKIDMQTYLPPHFEFNDIWRTF